ncbi:hypothetical protein GGX14DRAFT_637242 [Mycena pura]|uniref:Uncharacterized protein n=1 Tax=Mycena pura TaxID=153505 RepID=A0AAD6VDV3_9AGAR|nr:hypothetical protein GGX14DRAFT_637242 [Mycena pura]
MLHRGRSSDLPHKPVVLTWETAADEAHTSHHATWVSSPPLTIPSDSMHTDPRPRRDDPLHANNLQSRASLQGNLRIAMHAPHRAVSSGEGSEKHSLHGLPYAYPQRTCGSRSFRYTWIKKPQACAGSIPHGRASLPESGRKRLLWSILSVRRYHADLPSREERGAILSVKKWSSGLFCISEWVFAIVAVAGTTLFIGPLSTIPCHHILGGVSHGKSLLQVYCPGSGPRTL